MNHIARVSAVISLGILVYALVGTDKTIAQQPTDVVRRVNRPVPGRYIVVLRGNDDPEAVGVETAILRGGRLRHVYRQALRAFAIELPEAAARALARDPRIDYVEEDGVVTIQDVQTASTWGLDRVRDRTEVGDEFKRCLSSGRACGSRH